MALGDPAKVDAHARLEEAHRGSSEVHDYVPPVDGRERCLDLCLGRVSAGAIVVEIADARIGDVEGTPGHLREFQ